MLTRCKECGQEVSTEASACPHCGWKLPIFKYHSRDSKGQAKDGTISALDENDAIKKLQEQGLIVVSIAKIEAVPESVAIKKHEQVNEYLNSPQIVKAKFGIMDGVKLGFGMYIVLPLLIILGVIIFISVTTHLSEVTKSTAERQAEEQLQAAKLKKQALEALNKIDKSKFENVYRSAKALQGSIAVGVNYQRFSELIQNLATEILITRDKVKNKKEEELLKYYLDALTVYKDSETLWRYKISSESMEGLPPGQILIESEMFQIVAKYNLPKQIFHRFNREWGTISEDSFQEVLEIANKKTEEANSLLNE